MLQSSRQTIFGQGRIKPIGERKRNTVLMIASLSKVKGLSTFMAVAELLPDLHFRLMLSADMNLYRLI